MPTFNLTHEQRQSFERNNISPQQLDAIVAQFSDILQGIASKHPRRSQLVSNRDEQNWKPDRHRAIKVKAKVLED